MSAPASFEPALFAAPSGWMNIGPFNTVLLNEMFDRNLPHHVAFQS